MRKFYYDSVAEARRNANVKAIEKVFDRDALARVCEMSEYKFAEAYDMQVTQVAQKAPENYYFYRDNGSDILAVAHLDTVGLAHERTCRFLDTEGGPVVYSRALDDRLGAYIILELLPALGIHHDILLTVGEESGQSTADFFYPPMGKEYNWMIEFDRGGTDVVMYQYEDDETIALVEDCGADVGIGIFSDICYLEQLEVKGFNWGVGYRDYHGPRAHAYLDDTISMVAKYLTFHEDNAATYLPHQDEREIWTAYPDERNFEFADGERECDAIFGAHDHDDADCSAALEDLYDTSRKRSLLW